MNLVAQKAACLCIVFALLLLLNSCAHNEPTMLEADAEVWEMQITGGTSGKYNVLMIRTENQKGIHPVRGEFSGMATDRIGGRGMVKCKFDGQITNGDFKSNFTGTGDMVRGAVLIDGSLWGTLSDTEGRGKYYLSHQEGHSDGEWIMKRIRASNQK